MKISERTVKRLGEIITGDKGISPYRGGPKLVSFFNECGTNHTYGQGFPSRRMFAEDCIRQFNDTPTTYLHLSFNHRFQGDLRKSDAVDRKIEQLQARLPRYEQLLFQVNQSRDTEGMIHTLESEANCGSSCTACSSSRIASAVMKRLWKSSPAW